ncbi:MAG: twin-arginine translocase TatA/TatE family subunit [Bdellovibrionales bacterium]|nr:twin-arginine translocase TatA/TatE family subunit [Bdellovibrionales bacterium]
MGAFSLTHILLLILIGIIFLRPKKLGELSKAMGKSIKNFKQAKNEKEVEVISEENFKS